MLHVNDFVIDKPESEIPNPGDFVRRDIAGRPIFFVRSRRTGQINVFYNPLSPQERRATDEC